MDNAPPSTQPLMQNLAFQSYGHPSQQMMNQHQRQQQQQQQMPPNAIPTHISANPPRLTPEKRATHNAIERARRESLNDRFHKLAMSIPTLRQIRKPSKSLIVQKSLEHIVELHRRSETMETALVRMQRRVAELEEEARLAREGVLGTLGANGQPPSSVAQQQNVSAGNSAVGQQRNGMSQFPQLVVPQNIPQQHLLPQNLPNSYMPTNMQQLQGISMVETTMPVTPLSLGFQSPTGLAMNTTGSPPFPAGLTLDTSATGSSAYASFMMPQAYGSVSSPESNYSDGSNSDDEPHTASHTAPLDFASFMDPTQQQAFRSSGAISTTSSATFFPSFVPQSYRPLGGNSVLTPSPSPQSHPQMLLQGLSKATQ